MPKQRGGGSVISFCTMCKGGGGGVDQFSAILRGGSSYFITETCAYLIN